MAKLAVEGADGEVTQSFMGEQLLVIHGETVNGYWTMINSALRMWG